MPKKNSDSRNKVSEQPKNRKGSNSISNSTSSEEQEEVNITELITANTFYLESHLKNCVQQIKNFEPVIKSNQKKSSERELQVYRDLCLEGKLESKIDRAIIWTELLDVKNVEVSTFID
jgi:hypothetical protein